MDYSASITIPHQDGTLAVVTGASDGIGLVIARHLARAGAEVVLPVRTPSKGQAAAERIREAVPRARVSTRPLDLSSLASISAVVDSLIDDGRPIGLLVNNAGVMQPPRRQTTEDGFELQWGTNHLGHVALTLGLLPLLREGRARVTHQTSIAARRGRIAWDDLDGDSHYDAMAAYTGSKIALGLFARELDARSRAEGWGISSNLAHPGVSPTNLLAAQPGMGRQRATSGRRVIGLLSRAGVVNTVESAALPALMAATDPAAQGDQFFGPRRTVGGRPVRLQHLWEPFRDMHEARRVWKVSEEQLGRRPAA
ncbi:short chain dehydrogenase [Brachybacterium endophyticum]|uniref:Short chain dehydrogenase n=1 Tax=Brachybacterium endophyticum TaxID=2182385 RepID=A0A2U2RNL7_9MICO|nr:SDR family oxidoreductase [Brachybacterium endophyticum]PWH07473.1 short chain dehydrogenase [Brachybacterium endophyticum]